MTRVIEDQMHKKYQEHEGTLGAPQGTNRKCPECGSPMTYQTWESDDGGFEDSKYTCTNLLCKHVVWIDGIDS